MIAKWFTFILMLVLLAVGSYGAARFVSRSNSTYEPGIMAVQDYLNLTAEQRRVVADLTQEFAVSRPVLRQQVWQARDRFVALVRDPRADKDDVLLALHELSRAREEMAKNTVEYLLALRDCLTPAQQDKLTALVERGMCSLDSEVCGRPGGGACGLGILGGRGNRIRLRTTAP